MNTDPQVTQIVKARCDALLMAMIGSKQLCENWWNGQNAGFDFHTPAAVFEKDPKRVLNYLAHHANVGGGS